MTRAAPASAAALADAAPRLYWLDQPGRPGAEPALTGEARADLVVVGGGFTGLWAALQAKEDDQRPSDPRRSDP